MTREQAIDVLDKGNDSRDALCSAILVLGKPYDQKSIECHSSLVARYLEHPDFLVRHEAIWFLGSWGRRAEYLPQLLNATRQDENIDNRSFAARSIGSILLGVKDPNSIRELFCIFMDSGQPEELRVAAYSSLLLAFEGRSAQKSAMEFGPMGDKGLADTDGIFVHRVKEWVDEKRIEG